MSTSKMTWSIMLKKKKRKKKRKISLFLLEQKHLLNSYILGDKFCTDTFTVTSIQSQNPAGRHYITWATC